MARTTIEIPMQTHRVNTVLQIMEKVLEPEGYEQGVEDGKSIWIKGRGIFLLSQRFMAVFTDHSVIIQGWTKDMLLGESNLDDSFIGRKQKKGMMSCLKKIYAVMVKAKL